MKSVFIAGATGSIGQNALEVIESQKNDFKLKAFTSHSNFDKTINIIEQFAPEYAVITSEENYNRVLSRNTTQTKILYGLKEAVKLIRDEKFDIVLNSIVGGAGLEVTWQTVNSQKRLCLANKESLVIGGDFVMKKARENSCEILPVDSEHSALFQCMASGVENEIEKLWLTASGGPFYNYSGNFSEITVAQALKHPNWVMGRKITIDSATLMNKGLEVIEAYHLFSIPFSRIDVIIHPESIIHSIVEFIDGNFIAQLGPADMKGPIQYSFTWPDRKKSSNHKFDIFSKNKLNLIKPDTDKFRCLKLAYEAGQKGISYCTALNASNEIGVELFLDNKIKFTQIAEIIESGIEKYGNFKPQNIYDVIEKHQEIKETLRAVRSKK